MDLIQAPITPSLPCHKRGARAIIINGQQQEIDGRAPQGVNRRQFLEAAVAVSAALPLDAVAPLPLIRGRDHPMTRQQSSDVRTEM